MNQPVLLTREQQRLVERELEPGEQLLWAAPARPRIFTAHSIAIFIVAVFWCGTLLFFLGASSVWQSALAQGNMNSLIITSFLLPFIGVGYVLFWFALQESRTHSGVCAVTSHRALLIRRSRGTIILTEWSGEHLSMPDIRPRRGNRGDIILGIRVLRRKNGTRIIADGFHGIDNPEQIATLLRQATPTAPPPPATEPPLPEWPRSTSRATRQNIENLLSPGETIRWIVQRKPRLFNDATGFFFIFGLLWTAGFTALLLTPANRIEGDMPFFVVALFFLIGPLTLSSPWIYWAYARRQYDLLTDRRIIRYNPGWRSPSTQTHSYSAFESARLCIRPDGSGTLDLDYTIAKAGGMTNTFTIDNIQDIRNTCILARQLAAANDSRTPSGETSS